MKSRKLSAIADFLFEIGILAQTPRSGFHFLGSGQQSVAEHIHRTVFVGYLLAEMEGEVDTSKVIKMCLFHDMAEARTSDLNWVSQQYGKLDERQAVNDAVAGLPIEKEVVSLWEEYEQRETKESRIAKDADVIELIFRLKELADSGNGMALDWVPHIKKRLSTESGKVLADKALKTRSDAWWFKSGDDWWVSRKKKK